MKTKKSRRAAFFIFRAFIASVLCLAAGMLTLLAFGIAPQRDDQTQTSSSSRWFTRLAASFGIQSQRSVSGGAIKTDKYPAERPPATSQPVAPIPYSGPPVDLRPVLAVRSGKLRDMPPIDPDTVEKQYHPEPILPKPPTQSGGPDGAIQAVAEPEAEMPVAGVSFDGVGVGLANFRPGSNPPDVNGRVGATQYVQWNNTSFAVFNKTTGALEYGPAAGNTLFQALGGVCASHNNGDPVVSYDILAGRWVLSQFVVAAPAGGYSHQCFAVSATSDATGEYFLYDFVTDPVNFVDYPHQGVWPDGYYMATHVFSAQPAEVPPPPVNANQFITGRVYVFERDKMIHGLPARMQSVDLGRRSGMLPADLDSLTPPPPGEAEFVLSPNEALTEITNAYRVKVTWDPAPTIVLTRGEILAGIGNAPCLGTGRQCVPQPSPAAVPADNLDNLSGRYMYRLAYRNQGTHESLVVSATSNSSDANHGSVEWFEFRDTTAPPLTPADPPTMPTLYQNARYDIDTSYRFMPSIAMDKDGDILLGYSKSSTTVKPGIYIAGRLGGDRPGSTPDPLNTMGPEIEMQAGLGVQIGANAGNRWGDYSAMTLDPIDQCTFWYTNEYLKTNGAFNWSTRIASYKFPSCVSAANLYGIVTGTITSADTGAPIPGVRVVLSNDYASASDATGVYTILVPAGTYTATADADRSCTSGSPASATVSPPGGGSVVQNFVMTGVSDLQPNGVTIDDSVGTNDGIVNRFECVKLNLGAKNIGCAKETAISAKLTTNTPGVTVIDRDSSYPDLPIDAAGTNATPFKIFVGSDFGCGKNIDLSLELTYSGGTKTLQYSVPTCAGGPDQFIPESQLMTTDPSQADRIGRDQQPSKCSGKASPGGGFTTTAPHYYKTFTFTNTAGAPRCYTVTINADLNGPGDIESVAYDQVYDPAMINANYLGDSGISGLGTTVSEVSYSFTVPANHNFVVVVVTSGNTTNGTIASSKFRGTVSGFINNNPGSGACATAGSIPILTAAASRVSHTGVGPFDAAISLSGSGTEPRNAGGNYTAVLHFNQPIQSANVSVTSGTANPNPPVTVSGNDVLVQLSGVTDKQRLTLTASNVTAVSGGVLSSVSLSIGFLIGDVNADQRVNVGDTNQTKANSGSIANAQNFRSDVNLDGRINVGDTNMVKAASGGELPPRGSSKPSTRAR